MGVDRDYFSGLIKLPGDRAHPVAALETVGQGLIFIEPQYNNELELRRGISYAGKNRHVKLDYSDTITRFVAAW